MEDTDMRHFQCAIAFAAILGWTTMAAAADDQATPEEVIAKVRAAAGYIATEGEAGLSLFDEAETDYVWKDSYVFVWDCAADKVVAHPVPANRGLTISTISDMTGKAFGPPLCDAAKRPGGGWAEYFWPRAVRPAGADNLEYSGEPSRKVTYMLSVDGQPYQVGAGIIDETDSLEKLDALVRN
jgi:signal transduction histidine kinase